MRTLEMIQEKKAKPTIRSMIQDLQESLGARIDNLDKNTNIRFDEQEVRLTQKFEEMLTGERPKIIGDVRELFEKEWRPLIREDAKQLFETEWRPLIKKDALQLFEEQRPKLRDDIMSDIREHVAPLFEDTQAKAAKGIKDLDIKLSKKIDDFRHCP